MPPAFFSPSCDSHPHLLAPADNPRSSDAQRQPGVEVIRFGASLTFANKDVFRRAVIKVVEKADAERRLAESQGRPPKVALQVTRGVPCSAVSCVYEEDN